MSRAMTFQELNTLLIHIAAEHSPQHCVKGLMVKYVDPRIDMRSNEVFSITFRLYGGHDVQLHVCNENRDNPTSLFDRCMAALDGELPSP